MKALQAGFDGDTYDRNYPQHLKANYLLTTGGRTKATRKAPYFLCLEHCPLKLNHDLTLRSGPRRAG